MEAALMWVLYLEKKKPNQISDKCFNFCDHSNKCKGLYKINKQIKLKSKDFLPLFFSHIHNCNIKLSYKHEYQDTLFGQIRPSQMCSVQMGSSRVMWACPAWPQWIHRPHTEAHRWECDHKGLCDCKRSWGDDSYRWHHIFYDYIP